MTYEELLSIMDNYTFKDSAEPVKALRAVVELHSHTMDNHDRCVVDGQLRPCLTIQAIEKELS